MSDKIVLPAFEISKPTLTTYPVGEAEAIVAGVPTISKPTLTTFPATIADAVLDVALNYIETNGTEVHICSANPVNWAGLAAVTLGNEAACTYTGPVDHTSGRKTTLDAITDGDVTDSNTATHFAITNGVSAVYTVQELAAGQGVTNGNKWTLTEVIIALPDPIA